MAESLATTLHSRGNQTRPAQLLVRREDGVVPSGTSIQVTGRTQDSELNLIDNWDTGAQTTSQDYTVKEFAEVLAGYLTGWNGVSTTPLINSSNDALVNLFANRNRDGVPDVGFIEILSFTFTTP